MGTKGRGLKPKMLLHAFKNPHDYNSRNPMEKKNPCLRFIYQQKLSEILLLSS